MHYRELRHGRHNISEFGGDVLSYIISFIIGKSGPYTNYLLQTRDGDVGGTGFLKWWFGGPDMTVI